MLIGGGGGVIVLKNETGTICEKFTHVAPRIAKTPEFPADLSTVGLNSIKLY